MHRAATILVLTFLASSADAEGFRARVTEVHNGHTITVRDIVGATMTVRLEGIESPGRWRRFAARSRESLRELVKYRRVTVIPRGRDARGRMTATVLLEGVDVALEQLRRGMAWYDDSDAAIAGYAEAEAEAERERRGVWGVRVNDERW